MKLYYAQKCGIRVCITENFYKWLKENKKNYSNGEITINVKKFKEGENNASKK